MNRYTMTLAALMCIYTVAEAQDITFHTYRYGTGPLVIVAGATTDRVPQFNPCWSHMRPVTLIVTSTYWIPYPCDWPVYDAGIKWVIADYAIDANLNNSPDYFEFDYNCDGHVNMSDLPHFEQEYGVKWDLEDFTAMGLIFDDRSRP